MSGAGGGTGAGAGGVAATSTADTGVHSFDAAGWAFASSHAAKFTPPVVVSNGRCAVTLRAYEDRDVEPLQKAANDRDVWINLRDRFPHPYTGNAPASARMYRCVFAVLCAHARVCVRELLTACACAVTEKDAKFWVGMQCSAGKPLQTLAIDVDGEFAGSIGVECHSDVHRYSGELGYWIGRKHWGKGVMTLAVGAFLKYAFSHLNIIRVEAGCFARNAGSARVLAKTGFTLEGRLRCSVVKDGVLLDQLMHSILRSDVFPLADDSADTRTSSSVVSM